MLDTNQDPAGQITIRETARLDHRQVTTTNTKDGKLGLITKLTLVTGEQR